MREPLKDRARLEHILEAIDNVSSYIDGQTLTSLENDKMRYYAVVKNLEIIGEAVYKLTKSFRQNIPKPIGMTSHGFAMFSCMTITVSLSKPSGK